MRPTYQQSSRPCAYQRLWSNRSSIDRTRVAAPICPALAAAPQIKGDMDGAGHFARKRCDDGIRQSGDCAGADAQSERSAVDGGRPPGAPSRVTSYEASYFAQYAPRTRSTSPGGSRASSSISEHADRFGQVDVRGFAGAAGNVVINGARPSSKAESLEDDPRPDPCPARGPRRGRPGRPFGADYAGKSQVLNIILSAESGIDGNVTGSGRRRLHRLGRSPTSRARRSIRRGASTINLSAGTGNVNNQ